MNLLTNRFHNVLRKNVRFISKLSSQEKLQHRVRLFDEEKHRQLKQIERIEKIQVRVNEPGQECTLFMNKGLSTPYNCSLHMSEMMANRSALAKIDGTLWDIHRPLENDCTLEFLHFKSNDPLELNNAYWRSCAFILGYLVEKSFKDDVLVELLSPTNPNIKIGSFSYDAKIHLKDWKPTPSDLRCISIGATKLLGENLKFERLQVTLDIAKEMFQYNKYKIDHLNEIARGLEDNNELRKDITVYKMGEFVDVSNGPMIGNTSFIGRFNVTNIYDLETEKNGTVQRVQGVSIPSQLQLHSWTYNLLVERANKQTRVNPASDRLLTVDLTKEKKAAESG